MVYLAGGCIKKGEVNCQENPYLVKSIGRRYVGNDKYPRSCPIRVVQQSDESPG